MVILNIGLLAIIASFQAGIISLSRASRVTTASVIADQQMELYRAITYDSIRLAPATIPSGAPYTRDECNASRMVTGADNKSYRLDTYIVQTAPTGGRAIKQVTIVVRDELNLSKVYVRQASSFDQSTG